MEKEVCYTRIVPFVKYETKMKNGKKSEIAIDNLSGDEVKKMSRDPVILEKSEDTYILYETPLRFRGTGLRLRLCYLFDDLTKEEQERFFDRSEVIPTISSRTVSYIEESSKGKTRKRTK